MTLNAQYKVLPREGYTPQIGLMVDMLEELKERISADVKDLNLEQTDFEFDENANSIGALIMHLVATEAYYQIETLEGGRAWTAEETELWGVASNLGAMSQEKLKGKPITYYLEQWDAVRNKSLELLKTKDDAWFAADLHEDFNNHWVWFHVLEHSANHMGQIALVKNRLSK